MHPHSAGESDAKGDAASHLVQRIAGLSRNQTGANLLSHLAEDKELAKPLIGASSPIPITEEILTDFAALSAKARRAANWSKFVGVVFMTLALAFLCCAIFWPAIEKYFLKAPESIFTGLTQAVLTLIGGYCGAQYLKAKKRQTNIEDALRRLVFEHAHPSARIERLKAFLDRKARDARTGEPGHAPEKKGAGSTSEFVDKLRSTWSEPLSEPQVLAFMAQLKEISIKRYSLGLAAVVATAVSIVSIATAIVLPFATALLPGLLDGEVADTLQPMLGVALPVFFLALRKEARAKCAALDETVAAILNDTEPPSTKAARGIAAVTSIDGGMATFADQSPRLGEKKRDD